MIFLNLKQKPKCLHLFLAKNDVEESINLTERKENKF